MKPIHERLRRVVARAIESQLPMSVHDDQQAQLETADLLVRSALVDGQFGDLFASEPQGFGSGNTAIMVARLEATLSFVVKVDRSPGVVAEAHLLKQFATEPALPHATRETFPRIYAIDDVGPIFGYLMESLEGYVPLSETIAGGDDVIGSQILAVAWQRLLEPAYRATRQQRLVPNVTEDYFVRAARRLQAAASEGLLPGSDAPLRIVAGGETVEFARGWGEAVARASNRLRAVAPCFGTFVHGDPNPENVLWRAEGNGNVAVRLIDPKDWRVGDYLFDAAKIGHYLRVTSPVGRLPCAASQQSDGTCRTVQYTTDGLRAKAALEEGFLGLVAEFAAEAEGPMWRVRYELAVAANLLAIAGPRLARARARDGARQTTLGLVAFGEGLRLLQAADLER